MLDFDLMIAVPRFFVVVRFLLAFLRGLGLASGLDSRFTIISPLNASVGFNGGRLIGRPSRPAGFVFRSTFIPIIVPLM